MAKVQFKRDSKGIRQILTSPEVRSMVGTAARRMASAVRSREPRAEAVVVEEYTTDRAAASVTVQDVRGRAWQARDGLLTRAAANAGLEVGRGKGKGRRR